MSGTVIGGKRTAQTNKARYGYNYYKVIGAIGGRAGHTGGFADRELASRAGKIGGLKSRRRPAQPKNEDKFLIIDEEASLPIGLEVKASFWNKLRRKV